jgi:hypothetical protein
VTVLLPLPGTILDTPSANLRWYPVPGATAYRVQLTGEGDAAFTAPRIDTTVPEPTLLTDPLSPGSYLWRVQAIGPSTPAAFSPAQSLEVDPASVQGVAALRAMPARLAQAPQGTVLNVPLLAQRKDTTMLLIDRGVAESGAHAWDVAHPGTDPNDPADNWNCVLAVAAMINAYSGGTLSQDRIGFEIRGLTTSGAEGDLNWNRGLQRDEVDRALTFALGVAPARIDVAVLGPDERDFFWKIVVDEIDAGRPMAVLIPDHAVVIVGYVITAAGDRGLLINDPFEAQSNVVRLETFTLQHYYLTPLQVTAPSDEPGVAAHSDGDGVVDFDETQRFGTDPANEDSDGDRVKDKQDILASVFDPTYGYANLGIGRPDYDGDATEMERDTDSDDYGGETAGMGGCPDGVEDANRDGKKSGTETSNFDANDDRCLHARQETTYEADLSQDGFTVTLRGRYVVEAWVEEGDDGTLTGTASWTYEHEDLYVHPEIDWTQLCPSLTVFGNLRSETMTRSEGYDLPVTGTRIGDHVALAVAGEAPSTTETTVVECVEYAVQPPQTQTYEAPMPVVTIAPLEGDLVDGRFEATETVSPPGWAYPIHVHTLIEQKGQDTDGASVG